MITLHSAACGSQIKKLRIVPGLGQDVEARTKFIHLTADGCPAQAFFQMFQIVKSPKPLLPRPRMFNSCERVPVGSNDFGDTAAKS